MSVRIRMKKFGRSHRHFFRICAIDRKSPRDGKVLEELGTYNPHITDVDARAILNKDRIDHWIGVGAQPSDKCAILIKKYGTDGTHLAEQAVAVERQAQPFDMPDPGEPASMPKSDEPEAPAAEEKAAEAKTDEAAKPEEAKAEGDAPAEKKTEEKAEVAKEAPKAEEKTKEAKSE